MKHPSGEMAFMGMHPMRLNRSLILSLIVLSGIAVAHTEAQAQSSGNARANRAARFLDTEKRSKFILSYMHMGGTYQGREILDCIDVVDKDGSRIPGYFGIRVVYDWTTAFGDNSTTAVFLFDEMGTLFDVRGKTTSIISQPFDIASATLNVLGNVLIQAFGDKMTPEDRREFQNFVDGSDAKGLLIWALKFQEKVGL